MNLRFAAVVCCLWLCSVVCVAQSGSSSTDDAIWSLESKLMATSNASQLLMVPLTLIQGAASKGAGANRWLIQLEGGGWCNTRRSCIFRKTTRRGSSNHMEKVLAFTGILSNKANENPDFFNWNRVKLRYCDGASFTGDSEDQSSQLYYRGQRIWQVAMEELLSKGMQKADQVMHLLF
ncbi:hypothetical protein HID58_016813 [Brassica napus]|uniref:Pectin acetylesterase n=1 Tax=Brassica napus TaxID=3708 RepID=A0ABQ8D5B2_BRANA|nr:hypothetical protein HID58_016813 [Brassica napus]